MSYYRTCPSCGAALDPGERCDCQSRTESEARKGKEKAAQGATNTQDGKVETGLTAHISTFSLSDNREENQVWKR